MSDNDSSSDSSSDDYKDTQKIKIDTEPEEYNGVEIWNVEWNDDLQVRRWRIPFPIMVIFILAVTAIVAIYYYF